MINLFPEPKQVVDKNARSRRFSRIVLPGADEGLVRIARLRFWNYPEIEISAGPAEEAFSIRFRNSLQGIQVEQQHLFLTQGYTLDIGADSALVCYEGRAGMINAITSIKMLLQTVEGGFELPQCEIVDYPSLAVRAVAPTFSWYAGYGRIGFDCQLWGYDEWVQFMNISLDNKINQFNMVMYGYWPFEFEEYPETVFRNVPVKIWNAENRRWLTVRYTHPNIEEP